MCYDLERTLLYDKNNNIIFNSVACNDTHYGIGCNQLCPCITTNTADCDDKSGTCTCLPNWTGENCTIDVDE